MKKSNLVLPILWGILSASLLHGGDFPGAFQRFNAEIQGTITGVYFPDVNGDGARDLLVVHRVNDADFPRQWTLFIRTHGNFEKSEKVEIPIHPSAIVFDFGDMNGDGAEELLVLGKIGFETLSWDGSQLRASSRPALLSDPFFQYPDPNNLPRLPMIFQRDSIQYPILLLPQANGYSLLEWDGRIWAPQKLLYAPPEADFSEAGALQYPLPTVHFLDFNQDGEKDVSLLGKDLRVFLMNPFSHDSIEIALPDQVYPLNQERLALSSLEKVSPVTQKAFLADLDHDGAADLLISQSPQGGWTHTTSHAQIYPNTFGHLNDLPEQILQGENFTGRIHILDMNHDGLEDLLIERQSISVKQALRFLFSQKIKVGFDVHLNSDGHYSKTPDIQFDIPQEASIHWLELNCPVSFEGDWNGDGIRDMLIQTKGDAIAIVPGTGSGFDQTRMFYLPDMPTRNFTIYDDPSDACLLAAWDDDQHRLTVVISRHENP